MPVIEVAGLRRSYRSRTGVLRRTTREVEAVRGIDFEVERGELFGLLGPNGAGKTTTIKMLITLLLPTSGSARMLGRDVVLRSSPLSSARQPCRSDCRRGPGCRWLRSSRCPLSPAPASAS